MIYHLSCRVGLSPRGRGNQRERSPHSRRGGSIPAWAGEPPARVVMEPRIRVYPRVGGGTRYKAAVRAAHRGLSPRGRGNQAKPVEPSLNNGSIPAWAGEPQSDDISESLIWLYPRVGGGTALPTVYAVDVTGLSPRGRGNRALYQHLA